MCVLDIVSFVSTYQLEKSVLNSSSVAMSSCRASGSETSWLKAEQRQLEQIDTLAFYMVRCYDQSRWQLLLLGGYCPGGGRH